MSNMPPRMLSAPLRLTAMTLRGLGPYLQGARLEIKPLTILCGENGSGKSTWIEMLSKLKLTAAESGFPFTYLHDPNVTEGTTYSRSDLHAAIISPSSDRSDDPSEMSRKRRRKRKELCGIDAHNCGPPGCIGLEIEVTHQISDLLGELAPPENSSSAAQDFLWCGKLSAGTRLELRWAYPAVTHLGSREHTDGLHEWIELVLVVSNKRYTLLLNRSLDEVWEKLANEWNRKEQPHLCLSRSKAFVLGNEDDESESESIGIVDAGRWATDLRIVEGDPLAKPLCDNFLRLFKVIVQRVLSGYFPISAVREIHLAEVSEQTPIVAPPNSDEQCDASVQESQENRDSNILNARRYVGCRGEDTQTLHAYWAYNLMRQRYLPYTGWIDNSFNKNDFLAGWEGEENSPQRFPIHYRLQQLKYWNNILDLATPSVRLEWELGIKVDNTANDASITLLNDLLLKQDLFPNAYWPISSKGEAQILVGQTVRTIDETVRLNRLLLESCFSSNPSRGFVGVYCGHRTGYLFETFVSYWLKHLTGTEQKYGSFHGVPLNRFWNVPNGVSDSTTVPNGGLVHSERDWCQRGSDDGDTGYRDPEDNWGDLNQTIRPPTIPGLAAWHVMSTGFHQLAPIVVQAGLLHQNEIMAVENPEVHLHPSLQIKVAEFLMHQANAGKVMLIETHSDLIVRRILRAIRQEDIKQEAVRINFTHLEDGPSGLNFKHAQIEQLKINDDGQIANWPPGFMDDSLEEARRFIDAGIDDGGKADESDE